MNDIRAKVAYLHGLAEGLDLDTTSNEGRVLTTMLDVVADIAEQLIDVSEAQGELAEYVEDLDFDLGALEESVYGEVEGDELEGDEIQFEGDDDGPDVLFISEDALVENEDGVQVLVCPSCGEALSAGAGENEDVEDEAEVDVLCPVCGCSLQEVEGDFDTPHAGH